MKGLWKVLPLLLLSSCGGDLNSVAGPSSGKVSGLVCNDLPLLSAARDSVARRALVQQGSCREIRAYQAKQVEVIRTVTLPADGKYSQFILQGEKLWVQTSRIR